MLQSTAIFGLASLAALVSARPPLEKRSGFSGVATFNDYIKQGATVCGPLNATANSGYFGAATGDISHDISPGRCEGPQGPDFDMSICDGHGAIAHPETYHGPSCSNTVTNQCQTPTCFTVTNVGDFPTVGAPSGTPITVQVIDSCPAGHAQNYCKAQAIPPIDPRQRCGDGSTNYLDIDINAYPALTGGTAWDSSQPNLSIEITPVPC